MNSPAFWRLLKGWGGLVSRLEAAVRETMSAHQLGVCLT